MSYNITADWLGTNVYPSAMSGGISGFCVHHSAGTQLNVKSAFLANGTSAHYSIKDSDVIQYVPDTDGCWHAGDYWANTHLLSIENVNSGGEAQGWPVSEATVSTLVEFLADKCREHGISRLEVGKNIYGHRDFYATACPGVLYARLGEIAERVNANLEGDDMPSAEEVANAVWNFEQNGTLMRDRVQGTDEAANRAANEVCRTDDPTGRDVNMTDHEHIKWIAAKQAEMYDMLKKLVDNV